MARTLMMVRNSDDNNKYTYLDLRPVLSELYRLCHRLGFEKQRLAVESIVERMDGLIKERAEPGLVLQMLTDWIPDPRSKNAATLRAKDRAKLDKMWKARGGSSGAAIVAALQGGWGTGASSLPTHGGALAPPVLPPVAAAMPFLSAPPPPLVAPLTAGVSLGSLTLPFSKAASGAVQMHQPGAARGGGGKGGGGGRGKRSGKGKASALPPGTPSPQAVQARLDYNNKLKALQQAALPHPNGYHCPDCALAGRNTNHPAHECAYNECHHCRRGGHKSRSCQFPKYG